MKRLMEHAFFVDACPTPCRAHFATESRMRPDLHHNVINAYIEHLVPPRPLPLKHMEASAANEGFPIVGPAVGYTCYQLTRMLRPRNVFELGSGFGYSTAWFALALRENGGGVVHHTVLDESLSLMAREHLSALGVSDLVRYHVGESIACLKESRERFDMIFSDIAKRSYPESLPVIEDKLRLHGALLVDNLLWQGRVMDVNDTSPDTLGVRHFTEMVTKSRNWVATLLPAGDGLLLAYKVS